MTLHSYSIGVFAIPVAGAIWLVGNQPILMACVAIISGGYLYMSRRRRRQNRPRV